MRMPVTVVLGSQTKAIGVAGGFNALARAVPGSHPDRVYVVEPMRVPFAHRIVRYTEGLSEALAEGPETAR